MTQKFTDLTALAGADAATDDIICIVDINGDSSHKMTLEELINAIFLNIDTDDISNGLSNPITIKTSAYSVLAADSNDTFTTEGTSELIVFTLPTAVAGYKYTFVVQDNDGLKIKAAAGDTIRLANLVTIAEGYITSNVVGSVVTILSINATEWIVIHSLGDWDVETS